MDYKTSVILDLLCFLTLLFFTYFRRTFRVISRLALIREIVHTVITVMATIDIIVSLVAGTHTFVSGFAKPILFILFVRSLREAWKRVLLVIWDSRDIIMMIAAYIVFYGWTAYTLFNGTIEGQ